MEIVKRHMNNIHPKRKVLLNPGPSTTTDSVKLSQIVSDICPREKEFESIMRDIRHDLLKIVNANPSKYSTILFSGSGTLSIDVLISSLANENSCILVVNNGSYSQRAVEVCKYYGIRCIEIKSKDNCLPVLSDIENVVLSNDKISLIYTTHHETGTGILNPIREIGAIAHKYGKTFAVDTTSSFAMIPIDIERDNIDFLMSSSQKGITSMAGITFIIGNIDFIIKSGSFPKRSYYSNLYRQYDYFEKNGQMNFTPPVQIIYSMKQALIELFDETLEIKYARHRKAFELLYKRLSEMGFKFYVDCGMNAGLLLSILYPKNNNWSFERVHDYCYARGFTIYPGKVIEQPTFRLSVYGAIDYNDIERFCRVFRKALVTLGIDIPVQY